MTCVAHGPHSLLAACAVPAAQPELLTPPRARGGAHTGMWLLAGSQHGCHTCRHACMGPVRAQMGSSLPNDNCFKTWLVMRSDTSKDSLSCAVRCSGAPARTSLCQGWPVLSPSWPGSVGSTGMLQGGLRQIPKFRHSEVLHWFWLFRRAVLHLTWQETIYPSIAHPELFPLTPLTTIFLLWVVDVRWSLFLAQARYPPFHLPHNNKKWK